MVHDLLADTESDDELGPAPLVRLCKTKEGTDQNRTTMADEGRHVSDNKGETNDRQPKKRVKPHCITGPQGLSQTRIMIPEASVIGEAGGAAHQKRNVGQTQENKEPDRAATVHKERQHTTHKRRTLDQPTSQDTGKRLRQRRANNPQGEQALTAGEDTNAAVNTIAQQVQHIDCTRHDAGKRKQREHEQMHDNPRKRKK